MKTKLVMNLENIETLKAVILKLHQLSRAKNDQLAQRSKRAIMRSAGAKKEKKGCLVVFVFAESLCNMIKIKTEIQGGKNIGIKSSSDVGSMHSSLTTFTVATKNKKTEAFNGNYTTTRNQKTFSQATRKHNAACEETKRINITF